MVIALKKYIQLEVNQFSNHKIQENEETNSKIIHRTSRYGNGNFYQSTRSFFTALLLHYAVFDFPETVYPMWFFCDLLSAFRTYHCIISLGCQHDNLNFLLRPKGFQFAFHTNREGCKAPSQWLLPYLCGLNFIDDMTTKMNVGKN